MTPEKAVEQAVAVVGSTQALAEKLGVTKGAVSQWKLPGRRVPAEHCPVIERLTNGEICCEDLRPDVDWQFVRNGPEAATSTGPVNVPDHEKHTPPNIDKPVIW